MMTEILAPAGSYTAMTAAFQAGADAVYLGGERFGARAYADNLNQEEMLQAIDYAHLHGKKLYLTVNTMLKERELYDELYEYLLPFYREGLDAAIVQDFGVFSFIKRCFPKLAIHCSTQMTVTGEQSSRLLEEQGASRIVTAREISIDELKEIRKNINIEIESFVHGALCYCYSGRCLFSSMLGGRSGNRGKCAQPCRLPYQVLENGHRINGKNTQYALSPKDMCTIDLIPEILEAGVNSFKIEGRMKRPEYTAGVVRIYRKYMDQTLSGEFRGVSQEDRQELFLLYNRDGFHQGYYKQRNGKNMMALKNEKLSKNQSVDKKKQIIYDFLESEYVRKKDRVKVSMDVMLKKNQPAKIVLSAGKKSISYFAGQVQQAKNQPLSKERVEKQLRKTGATIYEIVDFFCEMDEDIFIPMQELNELRRGALEELEVCLLAEYRRSDSALSFLEEGKGTEGGSGKNKFFAVSVETAEQGERALQIDGVHRIYMTWQGFTPEFIRNCKKYKKEIYLNLPYMTRKDEKKRLEQLLSVMEKENADGCMVHTPEQYAIIKKMGWENKAVLDEALSCWNREGEIFWDELGYRGDTVPLELTYKEILNRRNIKSEMIVYGYVPLMTTAQCVKKNFDNCTGEHAELYLRDRYQKEFRVKCDCRFCYNRIYNCVPLSLLREMKDIVRLPVEGLRLSFTSESPGEMEKRTRQFLHAYATGVIPEAGYESTKGHFRRGV